MIDLTSLPRYDYYRGAILIGDVWTLRRGSVTMRCTISTNRFGWELRLTSGQNFLRSQVCKSEGEVLTVSAAWVTEAKSKGFTENAA